MGHAKPSILVCIVNWNGRHHLEYALPSFLGTQYPNLKLLLVDNASQDGTADYVRATFPTVQVVENVDNLMWAGGNNVGIRLGMVAGDDWIMLANNDVQVDPRWAEAGMSVAAEDPSIGVIGYRVLGESKRIDVLEWRRACVDFSELTFADDATITGCFMMIRRDVFNAIGLIDETYKLYGEDNDFIARVLKAGFRVVRCNLPIWHYSEGTSSSVHLFSAYMSTRNELRYYVKQEYFRVPGMLHWLLGRLVVACDPRLSVNVADSCQRRIHPTRNLLLNEVLVLWAFVWNLLHLRETRQSGALDDARCVAFREKRQQKGIE